MNEPTPTSSRHLIAIIEGIIYSNVFALAAFALAYVITFYGSVDAGTMLSFSEFVLVPLTMGIIAMKFWSKTGKRITRLLLYALLNTLIALGLSAIFMGEGTICLIIVSPLIFAFMWVGMLIAKYILPKDKAKLRVSTISLLALLFVYDTFSEHNYSNVVTDELTIQAPPHVVWKYIAEHPLNTGEPDYWLFKVGLPAPIQSTVSADTVGSERKCIFSNGATFDEVVIESIPGKRYTFDVTKQPEDPEIIGHIEILRGQFILEENADGSTKLIGKSWYRLMVYPAWYYDLWAEDITREVHIRVMKHIRTLAENDI